MSKVLKILLNNGSPLFDSSLKKLEVSTGYSGVDVKLIAEILSKSHVLMRILRLDITDTTAEEFFRAIESQANNDDLFEDTSYVGAIINGEVVSCNLSDIRNNLSVNFKDRICDGLRLALSNELIQRYSNHPRTSSQVIESLAKDMGLTWYTNEDSVYQHKDLETERQSVEEPYLLAIGDVFTDAFITVGDEAAKVIKDDQGVEWLAVPFGRKPPYETVDIVKSVGPSPNVAVSAARLGLRAGLMAWVGGDDTGQEAIDYLKTENINTDPIIIEDDKATSYWYVLVYKADRTMLVKSEQYRYEWHDPIERPNWIYLAYLGEDSWQLHEGLLDYLQRNPDIHFVFQPGTFQFKWGAGRLAGIYRRSKIVLMNREEAMDVTGLPYDSITNLARGLHNLGPEIVVITDGPNGSYVSDGSRVLSIPNYPDPKPPIDRTGAGDAFSSTFVAAIAEGESIETALAWSPINSMNVVQHIGAQKGLLSREELNHYLETAPDWYVVKEHHD